LGAGADLIGLGHEVKLIPPAHAKPYVRNDAADAAAICEAAWPALRSGAIGRESGRVDAPSHASGARWRWFHKGINSMQSVRASMLIPRGFLADDAVNDLSGTLITLRPASAASQCPACGAVSGRIHSRYSRRLADLPIAGGKVRLLLFARRFHCDAVLCVRRIFTERFGADVLAPWARRTARLDHIAHHLALVLGGGPAAEPGSADSRTGR
jgi:zinc-finger of transposase IS204/IS1001/IS1096/IS1165